MILDAITNMLATRAGPATLPGPTHPFWYTDLLSGRKTRTGIRVNEDVALTYSACWVASRIISETIASLPLILYRRTPDGGKERATDDPLYGVLHDAPNAESDSFTWCEMLAEWTVNWGNGFAEIDTNSRGEIVNLWPIHPSRIPKENVRRVDDGVIEYSVRNESAPPTLIRNDRLFHLTGVLSADGLYGRGVIRQARESIGMGLATERFGAAFFGNGATVRAVIEHPGVMSLPAQDRFRESWHKIYGGVDNAHQVAILEEGSSLKPFSVPPEEAQFLETRTFNISEIARWYRVPPHLLAELSHATFSNIEHESLSFVVHSIRPWLVRIERAINRQLLTPAQRSAGMFVEFLVDALLRGDAASRSQALQTQFQNGALTIDEWRAIENRNPVPNGLGQQHFVQLNMRPVDQPAEEDRMAEVQAAANVALRDRIAGMLAVEANAARRAAKKPSEFVATLEAFYTRHQDTMAAAIEAPLSTCAVAWAWSTGSAWIYAHHHCKASFEMLLEAAECPPSELAARVDAITADWRLRADEPFPWELRK